MVEVGLPRVFPATVALTTHLLLDAAWFSLAGRAVYPPAVRTHPRLVYASVAWLSLALAISSVKTKSPRTRTLYGAVVGALCYSVFNSTEAAIRSDWRGWVSVIDTLWGTTACAVAAFASGVAA